MMEIERALIRSMTREPDHQFAGRGGGGYCAHHVWYSDRYRVEIWHECKDGDWALSVTDEIAKRRVGPWPRRVPFAEVIAFLSDAETLRCYGIAPEEGR